MQQREEKKDPTQVFQKGVAVSLWQNAGDNLLSNWTRYAYSSWPFTSWPLKYLCPVGATKGKFKVGKSCDSWDRYAEDIELTHKLGCTAYRFSFEWARIEPVKGEIDKEAIKRYHKMLDVMERLGVEPNATLWHFTHPLWFEDLGAFEKEANLAHFIEYSKAMFQEFGHRIKLWATFNEPSCYIFLAYISAMAPPGYICNLPLAGTVLLNLLKAHTSTYHALKAMPGGERAQIGLVHHHITFQSHKPGWLHFPARVIADWMEYWWAWDLVDHWMLTGEFEWKLPLLGSWIKYKDPNGKPPCDWWGINFYSRPVLSWRLATTCMHGEVMTDMFYPIYPDGLYNAIKRSSAYGVPMYITETGIADKRDDRRALMINEYTAAMMRAISDGYDVRGLYYWTLLDNFEWAMGFTMRFGLYHWEADGSADRVLKEGSKALVRFYGSVPDDMEELRAMAKGARAGADGAQAGEEEEKGPVRRVAAAAAAAAGGIVTRARAAAAAAAGAGAAARA